MTSRQTGRRLRKITGQGNKGRLRRTAGQSEKRKASGETRRFVQLMACGGIFVFLVAAKLLLPARMAEFNERLSVLMAQNMDVQAVFSAVGRAFSGEGGVEGAVEEVYQAVFQPAQTPTVKSRTVRLQDGAALETLRPSAAQEDPPEAPPETEGPSPQEEPAAQEAGAAEGDASSLAYVLYSEENLPEGVSMEQAILGFDYTTPVMGVLSSSFGYREHPVEGEERFHYGLDLAADTGTEIRCFADGTVTAVGDSSSYGKYCVISHSGGYSTLYAHCSRVTVSSGAEVAKGEKVAEVGETGMATGPHLHFELQQNGTYLNPVYYVA